MTKTGDTGAAGELNITHSTTRRAVLAGAGALGATGLLAACATGDGDSLADGYRDPGAAPPAAPATTGAAPAESGQPAGGGAATLARASDIPEGGGKVFRDQGVVVTQPAKGTFKAFRATCTHQGCLVSKVTDGEIVCDCHFSKFSIEDGSVQGGPASQPLSEVGITEAGGALSLT